MIWYVLAHHGIRAIDNMTLHSSPPPLPQGWADTTLQPDVADPDIPTPNLKSLMDSGVRLGSYYTQTVCSPTRSSLMTGRFPFRMGMQHMQTITPASLAHLPLTTPTLPEMLKAQSNYETHMIGPTNIPPPERCCRSIALSMHCIGSSFSA